MSLSPPAKGVPSTCACCSAPFSLPASTVSKPDPLVGTIISNAHAHLNHSRSLPRHASSSLSLLLYLLCVQTTKSCLVSVWRCACPSPMDPSKRQRFLSWDDYFMSIAFLSAQRSKDPNKQVGACIVGPDRLILGVGYNGFPRGCSDDDLPWAKKSDVG